MKTLEKQDFAKLMLSIYSGYIRFYHYDAFYDILKLRELEVNKEPKQFHVFFRRMGSDMLFDDSVDINLHATYLKNNDVVLHVSYISNKDSNQDAYEIEIVKDSSDYLLYNEILHKQ